MRWFFKRNKITGIMQETSVPVEFLSYPKHEIPRLGEEYIKLLETQKTDDMCKCDWLIHPDDTDKPKGKRRKIRQGEHPHCPIHTKSGFLLGFLEWASKQDGS